MAGGPPDADLEMELETISPSTPLIFTPPSIHHNTLLSGASYKHFSPIPPSLLPPKCATSSESAETPIGPPCALGVDEAGRGPVLGPMVYGAFYLPIPLSEPLLSKTHHFDDSKVLTPAFRADLMEKLCTPPSSPASAIPASETTPDPSSLYDNCGWAVDLLSARSISSSMLHHTPYNLNAQAMDATIALIQAIIAKGVNVKEIYIDTIGQPGPYQKKLEKIFPTASVTVAKKADSLYPCVSAASVCAKVTRDRALEVLYEAYAPAAPTQKEDIQMEDSESKIEEGEAEEKAPEPAEADWGSGYPSDVRCTSWLKRNIDPIFGWGTECRFSWGTAKDLLENKAMAADVQWPVEQDDETHRLTDYFGVQGEKGKGEDDELAGWFGGRVGVEAF